LFDAESVEIPMSASLLDQLAVLKAAGRERDDRIDPTCLVAGDILHAQPMPAA